MYRDYKNTLTQVLVFSTYLHLQYVKNILCIIYIYMGTIVNITLSTILIHNKLTINTSVLVYMPTVLQGLMSVGTHTNKQNLCGT